MKKRIVLIMVLCLAIGLFGVAGFAKTDKGSSTAPEATTAAKKEVEIPKDATAGQKNAVEKAKQYLALSGFSEKGLQDQLTFEGYTEDEAAFGAKYCGADWNEEAARKAQQYLDMTAFSKQGLIDQLKFDGFTDEQAEYGVNKVYK